RRLVLPDTGVASASGLIPEVVVRGVWDVGHGACRCRVAVRGRRGVAAGGSDPLDVGGGHEPVAVRASGRRGSDQPNPWNGGQIGGDAGLGPADNPAAVHGLPRRPGEVGDDELALVVVQVRPGRGGTPDNTIAGVD